MDTTTDEVDASAGDGNCLTASSTCSLRAAIQEANALAGDDEITLPAGTYTLSLVGSGERLSATGDLNIENGNVTIVGDSMTTTIIDGNGTDRIFSVRSGGLNLSNAKLTNGNIAEEGGAIRGLGSDVTLSSVNISGNSAEDNGGGGIYMTSGDLSLSDSIISQNEVGGGGTFGGGGIYYFGSGSVDITNSTISQNAASGDGSTGSVPSYGGGIYIIGGALSISNSTVSGNMSTGNSSGFGGGIGLLGGTAAIYSSTITSNTTSGNGGGVYINDATSGSIQIKNSIIAANTAATAQDCASTSGTAIISDGYNLFGDTYGCNVTITTGDQEGNSSTSSALDPGLDPLQNNGGSTETHALQVSSSALNGGDPAGCTDPDGVALSYDQRGSGYPRTTTGTCDIGAYELQEYCGDGTIDSGEACDDGNFANNDGCSSTCQIEVCGDGIVQTSETCDDGNTTSGDGCTSVCILEVCGDGIRQTSEACDDGNTINNDRCSNACRAATCGDGITQAIIWEQCDDGNRVNTDRCSNICRRPVCGDAIVQPVIGENCDDGNTRNSDGCSSRCLSE